MGMKKYFLLVLALALSACGEADRIIGLGAGLQDAPEEGDFEPDYEDFNPAPDPATAEGTEMLNPGKPEPRKQEEDPESEQEFETGTDSFQQEASTFVREVQPRNPDDFSDFKIPSTPPSVAELGDSPLPSEHIIRDFTATHP